MQISRHWRMNAQRYRHEGVRFENGETHLQPRINPVHPEQDVTTQTVQDNSYTLMRTSERNHQSVAAR